MKTAKDVLKAIKDNDVKYVDLRFTDPRGKLQHVTFDVVDGRRGHLRRRHHVRRLVDRRLEGDQRVRHDADAGPDHGRRSTRSSRQPTLSIVCDILEPATGEPYNRDPRGIAKKAEAYLKSTGVGDTIYLRPGGRVLRLRRRAVHGRPLQHRLQARLHRAADQRRHGLRGRQPRPPLRDQGRLFPGAAARLARRTCAARCWRRWRAMGVKVEKHHHEVASAQHELGLKFDTLTLMADQHADLQVLHPQRRPRLRQDGDLHAEADLRRQRLGHARPPVDLEGRQAGLRRQQVCRPVAGVPLLHRRHHQARQGAQRLHQPVDQLLQAPGAGLRGAGAARLFGAQPLGLLPHPVARHRRRPSASRSASPIRRPTPISPSRRC